MSESASDPEETVASGDVVEFLYCRLDGVRYALELGWVSQALRRPAVTRVPRSPPGIYGTTTVEGNITVAVDTYELLELERPFAEPEEAHFIALAEDQTPQPIGLLVEAVDGIERHHIETVAQPEVGESPLSDHWFKASIVTETEANAQVFDARQLITELLPRK